MTSVRGEYDGAQNEGVCGAGKPQGQVRPQACSQRHTRVFSLLLDSFAMLEGKKLVAKMQLETDRRVLYVHEYVKDGEEERWTAGS